MEIHCPDCRNPFSTQQKTRYPRVLPCGHSVCSNCLNQKIRSWNNYLCRQCSQTINFDNTTIVPVNYIFFQLMEKMHNFMRERQWDSGNRVDDNNLAHSSIVKLQQQCLYTFCQRRKFQKDGIVEMFCSKQCKKNHEELEEQN